MPEDPFDLFGAWFAEAQTSEPNDPDAMALATSTADGHPSVRMVLLKGHGPDGFTWYTNMDSRKGGELAANAHAAICLHWKSLRRQVRAEGPVSQVGEVEADAYFASRSRDSQLGAWASDQSRALDARATFERRLVEAATRFDGSDVPRPPRWSGHRLAPTAIEFWEDRPGRLHHRRLFTRRADGSWDEGLLFP